MAKKFRRTLLSKIKKIERTITIKEPNSVKNFK